MTERGPARATRREPPERKAGHPGSLSALLGAHGVVECASAGLCRLLAAERDDLIGLPLAELLARVSHPEPAEAAAAVLAESESPVVWRHRDPDGKTLTLALSSSAVSRASDGGTGGFLLILEDLSARNAALEESRRFAEELEAVVRLTGDAYLRVDAAGNVERMTGASGGCARPGRPPDGPVSLSEAFIEDVASLYAGAISEAACGGQVVTREYRCVRNDSAVYEEARFLPLGDGRFAVVVRDITQRHERDQELKASEQRYRALVEVSPYGIVVAGADDRVRFANVTSARVLGVDIASGLRGMDLNRLVAPEQLEEGALEGRRYVRRLTSGSPADDEAAIAPTRHSLRAFDGRDIVLEVSLAGIDYEGEPGTLVMFRDATAEVHAECKARDSERMLAQVVESSPGGVHLWRANDEGGLVFAGGNPAADAILGIEHASLVGLTLDEAFPSMADGLEEELLRVAVDGDVRRWDAVERFAGITDRSFEVLAFQLTPGHAVAQFRDVTERERHLAVEEAYRQRLQGLAQELVRTEDQERRRLAVDLHDRVGQNLAMARIRVAEADRSVDPRTRESALRAALRLLSETIEQTRAITGELSPAGLYDLGLLPALRVLVEDVERLYGLRCEVVLPSAMEDPHPDIAAFVCRSARELLANVVKHADTSRARLCVEPGDGALTFTVEDEGVGMSPQAEAARTDAFGLMSIRERARALGGVVEVGELCGGTGTRVVVTVPTAVTHEDDGTAGERGIAR